MKHTRHTSKTRVVLYAFSDAFTGGRLDCGKLLARAKAMGVITNYDDGRDREPWFEAMPGAEARALRAVFLGAGYVPC